ncbi:MAG: hypothetical protein EOO88_24295 [Pedobacter sp.]|nr:MAG: hypothetical protein EOO88_24295 [Pedobacter sp.]
MARFDGKKITGLIGNMVFKNSADGKSTIIQRKAIGVKQTKGSKITSGIFAKASSLGKLFRIDFHSLMSGFYDRGMVNRLTKVNRDILEDCYDKANKTYVFEAGSFQRLEGFEFDSNSLLVNYFLKDVEVSVLAAELSVKIPAFETNKQLKFPGKANSCKMKLMVGVYNFELSRKPKYQYQEVNIEQGQGVVAEQSFVFEVAEGCLCIAGIGLEYFYKYNEVKTSLNSKELSPAALLFANVTPGNFVLPAGYKWKFEEALQLNPKKEETVDEEND